MRGIQRLLASVGLSGMILTGVLSVPGCSGDEQTKTGTLVEKTPEQVAAENSSMEGMKKEMMSRGMLKGQTPKK